MVKSQCKLNILKSWAMRSTDISAKAPYATCF